MNPIDLKNEIIQEKYVLKERKDNRIIIYYDNDPIYSFDNLKQLAIKLKS